MGGNYEKSVYNQLMEIMGRLDRMEQELCTEKADHKEDVTRLNKIIMHRKKHLCTTQNETQQHQSCYTEVTR